MKRTATVILILLLPAVLWAGGQIEISTIFILRGAAADPVDKNGLTPLLPAVENDRINVASFLADSEDRIPAALAIEKSPGVLTAILNDETINRLLY